MTTPTASLDPSSLYTLKSALEQQKLKVNITADHTITLQHGVGIRAKELTLEVSELGAHLGQLAPQARQGQLYAYASGVASGLVAPLRPEVMDQWTYEQLAGKMFLTVQTHAYSLGVKAATGSMAWHIKIDEHISLMTILELDRGHRTLTQELVDRWGVTQDRIYSAARSMLFHRTRDTRPTPLGDEPEVLKVYRGDGFDAARCVVICDVLFTELDEFSALFAMPHPDLLLLTKDKSAYQALQRAATSAFEGAQSPASPCVYELERGRPTRFTP